jgi:hypothetical protein
MVIRAGDRLEEVLSTDKAMIERLVGASAALAGLRNPTTRRVMGRLATVADVARLAGLEPEILVRRLNRAIDSDLRAHGAASSANPTSTP